MGLKAVGLLKKTGDALTTIADDVLRYAEACGKRSILETKPFTGKFQADDLGYIFPDGTINFFSKKSAMRYMQAQCTKALQGKNPYEHIVEIQGSRIVYENKGNHTSCWRSFKGKPEISGHGHPDTYARGCTTAPSIIDYHSFMQVKTQKLEVVYNSKGEWYILSKIPNAQVQNNKIFGCYHEIDVLAAKHYFSLAPKPVQLKLEKAIEERDLRTFEKLINEFFTTNENTSQLTKLTHTFWLKYGEKFGVKVDTNFSNFIDDFA